MSDTRLSRRSAPQDRLIRYFFSDLRYWGVEPDDIVIHNWRSDADTTLNQAFYLVPLWFYLKQEKKMPERKSMRRIKDCLRLYYKNKLNKSAVAGALHLARSTVGDYLQRPDSRVSTVLQLTAKRGANWYAELIRSASVKSLNR
ncbi:MAG: hypothetical protein GF344_14215 [Chitinivibrionales bacterium]|nr:hypothetical protein [Chitinivibrionales bacterium]MBD3357883.1 hypothetical protein [Chitinivibrionales bacterium]